MADQKPTFGEVLRYVFTRRPWGVIGSTDTMVLRFTGIEDTGPRDAPVPAPLAEVLGVEAAEVLGDGWIGDRVGSRRGSRGQAGGGGQHRKRRGFLLRRRQHSRRTAATRNSTSRNRWRGPRTGSWSSRTPGTTGWCSTTRTPRPFRPLPEPEGGVVRAEGGCSGSGRHDRGRRHRPQAEWFCSPSPVERRGWKQSAARGPVRVSWSSR